MTERERPFLRVWFEPRQPPTEAEQALERARLPLTGWQQVSKGLEFGLEAESIGDRSIMFSRGELPTTLASTPSSKHLT